MLDTLKLTLEEFEVDPRAELELQPASINAGTGELATEHVLWRINGREVRGMKAWHNSERVNITFNPRREAPGTQALCILQFSVPKVATGGNYYPTDYRGTQAALEAVQKHLDDVGIRANLKRATVGRLDAAKTVAAREPFAGYAPVLSRLQGKRTERRDYGNMFLFGNTRWEAAFYDKCEEMRRAKVPVAGLPVNSVRAELRALKASKVRELFGIERAGELVDSLDHIRAVYRSHMEEQLFKHELPDDPALSRSDLVEQLTVCKERSRFWYRAWCTGYAMQQLARDADALKYAVRVVASDPKTARRIIKEIEQGEREGLALQQVGPSSRTWGELYDELREKVLA
jgi:hypothetical protein